MEPRPQRSRPPASSPAQGTRQQPTQDIPPGYAGDPTAFVAPQRTEYDYSPLDLAPPGQRRRRQLVAAAIGALSVLLLGAIIFFSYLLLRDEDPPNQNDDLLAAQTQIANQEATLAANQTVVAQAAAEQTAAAEALNPGSTDETPAAQETEEPASGNEEGTSATEEAATETPAGNEGDQTTAEETPAAPDLSGNASLDEAGLEALLPTADQVPTTLTEEINTTRAQEQVVESLGGGRPAEANLEDWGWSGNVDRAFQVADPAAADPASTTYLGVSIHGFASPTAAAQAMPFFADILISGGGYTELDAPDIGEAATMLTMTNEDGVTFVTLYVQDGSVLYRFLGSSPAGDPAQNVLALANETLGG